MERLTERYKDSIANVVLIRECGDKLCKDIECDCSKCELEKALEKLADYEDLEERLHKIFGEKSAFSLADVIDALEMKLSEPDKKHPVNARILTYEEANKWQEYKDLEEQGLLVRLPCKPGDTMFDIVGKPPKIIEHQASSFYIDENGIHLRILGGALEKKQGAKVYFSREEAEKKLEEMQNG